MLCSFKSAGGAGADGREGWDQCFNHTGTHTHTLEWFLCTLSLTDCISRLKGVFYCVDLPRQA